VTDSAFSPRPAAPGPVASHTCPARRPAGPRPSGPAQPRRRPATRGNRARRAHGAVNARSSCTHRRGDTLDGGAVGAGQLQGVADEHRWGPGVAWGSPNWRRIDGAVGRRGAVAVNGGGAGAVVVDDGALALYHEERER
jgi:hypothetical protein